MRRRHLFALVIILVSLSLSIPVRAQKLPVIGFVQFITQAPGEASRKGAIEALNAAGYIDGKTATFLFGNPEGDSAKLTTILQNYVDQKVDLILTENTPVMQAAYKATMDHQTPPVVFSTDTSPYAAGVAQAPCVHPSWMSGTQAFAPYASTVPLILKIKPGAKEVGYIYNPAEANSVASLAVVQPLADKLGLKLDIKTVANTSEVEAAAVALAAIPVDVFYVPTDITMLGSIPTLTKVANPRKIPVIASDPASPTQGAVLGQGVDYEQDGRNAGMIAALILSKKIDIATTKINNTDAALTTINLDAAAALNITIPADLMAMANTVIKDGKSVASAAPTMAATMSASDSDAFVKSLQCTPEEMSATPEATAVK